MLRIIHAPCLGRAVKLGRRRPIAPHAARLELARYIRPKLPAPPPSCDYSGAAWSSLTAIMGNDRLGDCVVAAGYHVEGVETGNAGALFIPTEAQIEHDYSAIGGYVPGRPDTDQGCYLSDALGYWQRTGFANGTRLLGSIAIDPTDLRAVKLACYLFENLLLGFEMPEPWIDPFPEGSGFVWGLAGEPDPELGHCVCAVGYGPDGVNVDSWGMIGTVTWPALMAYCSAEENGELWAVLTPDQLARGQQRAPNGVDWTTLVADFDAMGGSVPIPAPPAPTPPAPTPPAPVRGVTLKQAQEWAMSEFTRRGCYPLSAVLSKVSTGLAKHWPKGR